MLVDILVSGTVFITIVIQVNVMLLDLQVNESMEGSLSVNLNDILVRGYVR